MAGAATRPAEQVLDDDPQRARRILAKLDLRDRVQAVIFAYEHRVAQPGDSR